MLVLNPMGLNCMMPLSASFMLRKLCSYLRENGLALALREQGRIERTLFILDWLQNVELRRRVNAVLNKGEARNALARAVFIHRLGDIRDRTRYRASSLNLVKATIVPWNTVYLVGAARRRQFERRFSAAVDVTAWLGAHQDVNAAVKSSSEQSTSSLAICLKTMPPPCAM